jgi:hypothetical protein
LSNKKDGDGKPKRRGRPPKSEIVSRKRGEVGTRGRPKGDAAIINDAALNDDHKNQAAAWKLVMDRVLPSSYFEKDKAGGSKGGINISITGVGGETTIISENTEQEEAEDGEFIDIQS